MEWIPVAVSVVSGTLSVVSAVIAVRALRNQRFIAAQQVTFSILQKAREMIVDQPSILSIHGVPETALSELGVTPQEVAYLATSFSAGEVFYRLTDPKEVVFTEYRKTLLDNPKVRQVWEKVFRKRFISNGKFSDAIDRYYGIA